MTKQYTIMTKYIHIELELQTKDVITHGRMTRLEMEYDAAIHSAIQYLTGQLRSIEIQFHDELKEVGK